MPKWYTFLKIFPFCSLLYPLIVHFSFLSSSYRLAALQCLLLLLLGYLWHRSHGQTEFFCHDECVCSSLALSHASGLAESCFLSAYAFSCPHVLVSFLSEQVLLIASKAGWGWETNKVTWPCLTCYFFNCCFSCSYGFLIWEELIFLPLTSLPCFSTERLLLFLS